MTFDSRLTKNKLWVMVWLTVLPFHLQAQHVKYSANASIGLSYIPLKNGMETSGRTYPRLSTNFGGMAQFGIGEKSSIDIELRWMRLKSEYDIGVYKGIIHQQQMVVHFIGLPVQYRHQLGKFGLKAGALPLLFVASSSKFEAFKYGANGGVEEVSDERTRTNWRPISVGVALGVDYKMSERIKLRISNDYGFHDITSTFTDRTTTGAFGREFIQLSMGLEYMFNKMP